MTGQVVQLFPGQGSQWPGMGADLLESSPAFGSAVDACDDVVAARTGWSIRRALADGTPDRLAGILDLQLMLFTMEVALAAVWDERRARRDAVAGTSLGEIAAAYVCGALALDDALAVVVARGTLLEEYRPEGGTVVLNIDGDAVGGVLAGLDDDAWVIGFNGPGTTTFSGREPALAELLRRGDELGVFAARVKVDYPAHCPLLEPLVAPLRELLAGIRPSDRAIPFYSAVTGALMSGNELGADYWAANLVQPVLGAQLLQQLLADRFDVILEVTPHPIFAKPTHDAIVAAGASAQHLPTLRRNRDSSECLAESRARLHAAGGCRLLADAQDSLPSSAHGDFAS